MQLSLKILFTACRIIREVLASEEASLAADLDFLLRYEDGAVVAATVRAVLWNTVIRLGRPEGLPADRPVPMEQIEITARDFLKGWLKHVEAQKRSI